LDEAIATIGMGNGGIAITPSMMIIAIEVGSGTPTGLTIGMTADA
jgi:hypothetical protein